MDNLTKQSVVDLLWSQVDRFESLAREAKNCGNPSEYVRFSTIADACAYSASDLSKQIRRG